MENNVLLSLQILEEKLILWAEMDLYVSETVVQNSGWVVCETKYEEISKDEN